MTWLKIDIDIIRIIASDLIKKMNLFSDILLDMNTKWSIGNGDE
jgi:hypothetical protein